MIGHRLFSWGNCAMSDSLNQSERYRALAEEYRRLAATSSSIENRERYLRMARITAGWLSPKNQADQPTTISRQAMATENADNARPARYQRPFQTPSRLGGTGGSRLHCCVGQVIHSSIGRNP